MSGVVPVNPKMTFLSSIGEPLVGGKVFVYLAGTTTPATSWQDSAQTIANMNPIILDARGQCSLWVDSASTYKFVVTDVNNVTQYTVDNVTGAATAAALATYTTQAQTAAANAQAAQNATYNLKGVYSTTALGIAATSNGQYFGVPQTYGDGADVYLNSSGTATATGSTMVITAAGQSAQTIQINERIPSLFPGLSVNPTAQFAAVDGWDRNGMYLPNRMSSQMPSGNVIAASSGHIIGSSVIGSDTEYFANGPTFTGTAKRLQIPNSGRYDFFNTALPAGTWTMKFQVKNNAVGTSPAFTYGDFNAGAGSGAAMSGPSTVTDAGYTQFSVTITANGSTANWLMIRNTSGSAADLLLDEVQLYSGAVVPAFSSEVNVSALRPRLGLPGKLTRNNNAIDLSASSGVPSMVRLSSYPLKKSVAAMTVIAIVSTNESSGIAEKIFGTGNGDPAFCLGITSGNAYGIPALPRSATSDISPDAMLRIANNGYHVIGARFNATTQSFFFHEIEAYQKTSALGPLTLEKLVSLCDTDGSLPFKGKLTNGLYVEQYLTDAQMYDAISKLRDHHAAQGEAPVQKAFNVVLVEGDSITATTSPASYNRQYFADLPTNIYGVSRAVSGSSITTVQARQAQTVKNIGEVLKNGNQPIVSLLIGANGIPTITDLTNYYDACRAAGAKVIAITLLPNVVDGSFSESARQSLNTAIRAASSHYDALADFGNDPTMGVANSFALDPTKWNDAGKHPSTTGHAILKGIWATAVNSLKV